MPTSMRRVVAALAAAGIAALALVCCAGDDDRGGAPAARDRGRVTQLPEPEPRAGEAAAPIDEALMLALAQAKNFHRKAKVYMTDGNLDEAIRAVRQILGIRFPDGAPEGEDVRLDAQAMLAKLLVARGEVDEAMTVADGAIASATRESFFLGNLHQVRGEIWEARAALLDDDGSDDAKAEARAARLEALDAYDRSNAIYVRLQERLAEELREEAP